VIKSPFYPASFSSQIQCVWTVKALNPSSRIKIEFQDWVIHASGKGCDQTYLQVTDGSKDVDHATGRARGPRGPARARSLAQRCDAVIFRQSAEI